MNDPYKNMIEMQQAMLEGWMNSANQMMQYWKHLMELQERLLGQATFGRPSPASTASAVSTSILKRTSEGC
jgi:hypothetical protein